MKDSSLGPNKFTYIKTYIKSTQHDTQRDMKTSQRI